MMMMMTMMIYKYSSGHGRGGIYAVRPLCLRHEQRRCSCGMRLAAQYKCYRSLHLPFCWRLNLLVLNIRFLDLLHQSSLTFPDYQNLL